MKVVGSQIGRILVEMHMDSFVVAGSLDDAASLGTELHAEVGIAVVADSQAGAGKRSAADHSLIVVDSLVVHMLGVLDSDLDLQERLAHDIQEEARTS